VYLCVWASDFGCHGDTSVTSLLAPPPFCFFFIRWWMISIGFKRIEINWIKPPWIYKFLFEFFFLVFCFDSVCFAVYVNIFRLIISVVFSFSVFVYTQEPICAPSLVLYLHFLYFEIGSQTRTATTTTNNFVSKCFSFRVHSNILFSYFSPSPPPPTPPPRVMSFC